MKTYKHFKKVILFSIKISKELKVNNVVLIHDVTTILPFFLSIYFKSKHVYIDVTETTILNERTSSFYRSSIRLFRILYEKAAFNELSRAIKVSTSSYYFSKEINEKYCLEPLFVTHYSLDYVKNRELVCQCMKLKENNTWIAWPSTFSNLTGADLAIDTLSILPENFKLVIVGAPLESNLKLNIIGAGLLKRVIVFDKLDFDDYKTVINVCDLGWVFFKNTYENLTKCLPNRFMDLVSLGVPVLSTPNKSIGYAITRKIQWGKIVDHVSARLIAETTMRTVNSRYSPPSKDEFNGVLNAISIKDYVTKSLAINNRDKILLIAMRSLENRMRIFYIVKELLVQNIEVTVLCIRKAPDFKKLGLTDSQLIKLSVVVL